MLAARMVLLYLVSPMPGSPEAVLCLSVGEGPKLKATDLGIESSFYFSLSLSLVFVKQAFYHCVRSSFVLWCVCVGFVYVSTYMCVRSSERLMLCVSFLYHFPPNFLRCTPPSTWRDRLLTG